MWIVYTLVTLCMLAAIAYVIIRQFGYTHINPNDFVLISRLGIYNRTATTNNPESPLVLVIPGIEKITHRISKRLRQITPIVHFEEGNLSLKLTLKVKYQVITKQAKTAATQLPQPVPTICDFLNKKIPEISAMLDKEDQTLFKTTLASAVSEQLSERLACYGYNLLEMTIDKITVADKIAFDLNHTHAIMDLLQTPSQQRDNAWWDDFQKHIPDANFAAPEEQIQAISQSLKGIILNPPEDEYFDNPVQVKDVFGSCLEQGLGLAIKNPSDTKPLLTLSFFEIYAITTDQYDTLVLQQAIPQGPFYNAEANWIPMGPVDEKYLDPIIIKGVAAYLKQLGINSPQASKVAESGGDYSTSLAFNVFLEQFNNESDFEAFVRQFYWYIPRHIGVVGLSNKSAAASELQSIDEES